MKKEYRNIIIEVINIDEEDVIRTSGEGKQFGDPLPGVDPDDSLLG